MRIASFLLLAIATGSVAAKKRAGARRARYMTPPDIQADSDLGERVLSQARRVNDYENANNYYAAENANGYYNNGQYYNPNNANNNNNNNGGNNNAQSQWYANWQLAGSKWLKGYAIKFQGCYDTFKWNYDAEDADDVRLKVQHLVRFRLCPIEYCGTNSQNGCRNNFGDYVIDLETFLESYIAAKDIYEEWAAMEAQDQDWYEEYQQGQYSYENEQEQQEKYFDLEQYMYCQDSGIAIQPSDWTALYGYDAYQAGNNGGNNGNDNEDEESWNDAGNYYMGPSCGQQGGAINMGLFKDEDCTIPADEKNGRDMYFLLSGGITLPFSETSMIEYDCFACKEPDSNNDAGDDAEDDDDINDVCETIYLNSGKCETSLPKWAFNTYKTKNNAACNYIDGIKVARADGSIVTTRRNAPGHLGSKYTGGIMMGMFGSAFLGLSYYVYYLKNKFERASIEIE